MTQSLAHGALRLLAWAFGFLAADLVSVCLDMWWDAEHDMLPAIYTSLTASPDRTGPTSFDSAGIVGHGEGKRTRICIDPS